MSGETRLIRASADIFSMLGTRTEDGARLTVEWGKPIGHCPDSDEWIYEPVFTRHDDDRLGVVDVQALRLAIYEVSLRHDWANSRDEVDRTEEIAAEYDLIRSAS